MVKKDTEEVTENARAKKYLINFAFIAIVPLMSAAFGSYVTADRAIARIDERLIGMKEAFNNKNEEHEDILQKLQAHHSEMDAIISRNTARIDYLERMCFERNNK